MDTETQSLVRRAGNRPQLTLEFQQIADQLVNDQLPRDAT
jgi:hypothetical protein